MVQIHCALAVTMQPDRLTLDYFHPSLCVHWLYSPTMQPDRLTLDFFHPSLCVHWLYSPCNLTGCHWTTSTLHCMCTGCTHHATWQVDIGLLPPLIVCALAVLTHHATWQVDIGLLPPLIVCALAVLTHHATWQVDIGLLPPLIVCALAVLTMQSDRLTLDYFHPSLYVHWLYSPCNLTGWHWTTSTPHCVCTGCTHHATWQVDIGLLPPLIVCALAVLTMQPDRLTLDYFHPSLCVHWLYSPCNLTGWHWTTSTPHCMCTGCTHHATWQVDIGLLPPLIVCALAVLTMQPDRLTLDYFHPSLCVHWLYSPCNLTGWHWTTSTPHCVCTGCTHHATWQVDIGLLPPLIVCALAVLTHHATWQVDIGLLPPLIVCALAVLTHHATWQVDIGLLPPLIVCALAVLIMQPDRLTLDYFHPSLYVHWLYSPCNLTGWHWTTSTPHCVCTGCTHHATWQVDIGLLPPLIVCALAVLTMQPDRLTLDYFHPSLCVHWLYSPCNLTGWHWTTSTPHCMCTGCTHPPCNLTGWHWTTSTPHCMCTGCTHPPCNLTGWHWTTSTPHCVCTGCTHHATWQVDIGLLPPLIVCALAVLIMQPDRLTLDYFHPSLYLHYD